MFLKEFFEKVNFEKSQQRQQKHEKLPSMQVVNLLAGYRFSMPFLSSADFQINFYKKSLSGLSAEPEISVKTVCDDESRFEKNDFNKDKKGTSQIIIHLN